MIIINKKNMKIKIQHLDRTTQEIEFNNSLYIEIGGIQIKLIHGGIQLNSEGQIEVKPKSSNCLVIKQEK